MTDETHAFISDIKERKHMARSAKAKVKGKGRYVSLPSDNLTAKERKELNGAMSTYSMDKPHTYLELLSFPTDLRKEYMQGILDKYAPSTSDLYQMLRVSPITYRNFMDSLGIVKPRSYMTYDQKKTWRIFMGQEEDEGVKIVEEKMAEKAQEAFATTPPIGEITHMTICVVGKPLAVASNLPLMLDNNKKYHFSINISEVVQKEEEDESSVCEAG